MGNFKIFRSSAGSGKTYTLTREYIKLALSSPGLGQEPVRDDYFRRILAITFTNDAAKEMKERILSELKRLSQLPHDSKDLLNLFQEIQNEYPQTLEDTKELKNRCQSVLKAILHNYSDFAVSTIDSFVSRLAQSFKRDLGLPYNYELELELEVALQTAAEELLALAGKPDCHELTQWLMRFLQNQLYEGKNWNLKDDLVQTAEALFDERKAKIIQAIKSLELKKFSQIEIEIKNIKNSYKTELSTLAEKALNTIKSYGLQAEDFNNKLIYTYFQKNKEFVNTEISNTLLSQVENRDFSKKSPQKDLVQQISNELADYFEQIEELKRQKEGQYLLCDELSKRIYQFGLLKMIWEFLQQRNWDKERVQLAELHQKIGQIIENEPVPFIYEKLGERFYHIMIDEFQDTSLLQWQNLLVLVCNALSQGTVSLVVGDAKQAIYRWRGGKASMLIDLPKIPPTENLQKQQNAQIMAIEAEPKVLERNFRSAKSIVEFNNSFFSFVSENYAQLYPNLKSFYQNPTQLPVKFYAGRVSIEENEDHLKRSTEIVKSWIEKGVGLQQIAILCNTNQQAGALASHFLAQGIGVVTAESLWVRQSPSVDVLIRMLRVIENPSDLQNKGYFLLKLKSIHQIDLDDEKLVEMATNKTLYWFFEALKNYFFIEIDEKRLSFLSLFQKIIELLRVLKLPKNKHEQPFIQKFLDFALDFSENKSESISEFIAEFENNHKLSINLSQGVDAVKIMTIHRSKGLQFPFVLIPFADWKLGKHDQEIWDHWPESPLEGFPYAIAKSSKKFQNMSSSLALSVAQEIELEAIEQINKLYVAMTRAEIEMYILHKKNQKDKVSKLLSEYCTFAQKSIFGDTEPVYPHHSANENLYFNEFQYHSLMDFSVKVDSRTLNNLQDSEISERERGEVIHSLMERIFTWQDKETVLQQALQSNKIKPDDLKKLSQNLDRIFSIQLIRDCFEEHAVFLNEPEIIYKQSGKAKTERPDRVVLFEDKIVILDFKTGAKRKEYHKQVEHYAELLQSIYQNKNTKKALLYLDIGEVEIW
jgi:ATP-dependent exoDNAse (exonuclease V) beta subunit